jgi:Cytochrome P460
MKGRTMKWFTILILAIVIALTILTALPFASGHAEDETSPIFGVKIPAGYRDWRLISVAHEEGSLNDLRAILGNDVAIRAAREGKPPFPDGTIIARLAWNYDPLEESSKGLWPPPIFRGRAT